MNQKPRPFNVPQKFVPQTNAFVGPFDQAGNVGHDERAIEIDLHAAQVRMFCGKRIGSDFGPRARKTAQQRALAGIRFANQSDVGNHFQLEPQSARLAGFAGCILTRRAVGGRLEPNVALAALAPSGHYDPFADCRKILHNVAVLGIEDDRTRRDGNHEIFGRSTMATGAAARLTAGRVPSAAMGQWGKAVGVFLGHHDDAAAITTVATIRPAAGDIFLPAEADAAVPTLARLHKNFHFVDKHKPC